MALESLRDGLNRVGKTATTGLTALVGVTGTAAAQDSGKIPCNQLPGQIQAVRDLLHQIQLMGVALAFSVAAVVLVYAGLLWMSGDPAKQDQARQVIVNVFVGLLIVVMAGGLIEWVKTIICSTGG